MSERNNWFETWLALVVWAVILTGAVGLVVYGPLVWNLLKWAEVFN